MLQPENTAFLFPGQGSQSVGMGKQLAEVYGTARQTFEEADDLLKVKLSELAWNGPDEHLNDTLNTQPALMVHSVAALRVFQEIHPGWQPACTAGHSMGELSALVAAGALPFEDALFLVRKRGELMQRAGIVNPGGMAAILGLDIPTLEALSSQVSTPEQIVQVANDNCQGQVVVSGASEALDRLLELARSAGARRAMRLAVSIAAHSPLMTSAQTEFNLAVEAAQIRDAVLPLIGNVGAAPLTSASEIQEDLRLQLTSRVRWTDSVQRMAKMGVEHFIEMGSGSVLTGLVKRILSSPACYNLSNPDDFSRLPI